MKYIYRSVIVLLLSVILLSCETEIRTSSIEGDIVMAGEYDGPMDRIFIYAEKTDDSSVSRCTMADQYGHYVFEGLPLGSYKLRYVIPDIDVLYREIIVREGITADGDITVDPLSAAVRGEVHIDPTRAEEYPDPVVRLSRKDDGSLVGETVPDLTGAYRFHPVSPGMYVVSLISGNETLVCHEVEVEPKKDARMDLYVDGLYEICGRGVCVDGPVSDCPIVLIDLSTGNDMRTYPDEEGRWSFGRLPEGEYIIHVSTPLYKPFVKEIGNLSERSRFDLPLCRPESEQTVVLSGRTVFRLEVNAPIYHGFGFTLREGGKQKGESFGSMDIWGEREKNYEEPTEVSIENISDKGKNLTCLMEKETLTDEYGAYDLVTIHVDRMIPEAGFLRTFFDYEEAAAVDPPTMMLLDDDYGNGNQYHGPDERLDNLAGIPVLENGSHSILRLSPGEKRVIETCAWNRETYPFYRFVPEKVTVRTNQVVDTEIENKGQLITFRFPEAVKGEAFFLKCPFPELIGHSFQIREPKELYAYAWGPCGTYSFRMVGDNGKTYVSGDVLLTPDRKEAVIMTEVNEQQ